MDGLGKHYAKWNKLEKDKHYGITYTCNLKNTQQSGEYDKKAADSQIRRTTIGY